jgi:hypothetical protein
MKKVILRTWVSIGLFGSVVSEKASGQQSTSTSPVTQGSPAVSKNSELPFSPLSVPAKSTLFQRLHPASLPSEAEFRGSLGQPSFFGFSRGFAVGSHLFENALSTLMGQHIYSSGTWLQYDLLLGYQFLNGVDSKHFASAYAGYTSFSLKRTATGSGEQKIASSGVVFQVDYALSVSPEFSLGIQASGLFGKDKFTGEAQDLLLESQDGTNVRRMVNDFYAESNHLPKVRASFPMEFEVINWKASHIDLPNHLRGYLSVEPFYRQFELKIDKAFESVEKNVGIKIGPKLAYESLNEKAGRYALSVDFGAEISGGKITTQFEDTNPQVALFSLKKRKILTPFLNAQYSLKF